ncbi:hypothetical protein KR074_004233, partial [Drosophila pseudoananassae]
PRSPHCNLYKALGYNALDSRSYRQEVTVELRKSKKEQALMKRRNLSEVMEDDSTAPEMMDTFVNDDNNGNQNQMLVDDIKTDNMRLLCQSISEANNFVDNNVVVNTVHEIMQAVANSFDENDQIMGLQCARQLLGCLQDPPIDMMIQHGLLPCCVDFLKRNHNPKLQLEAAWTLTNITSGNTEQTMAVVNSGAVPCLMALLRSESTEVVEQAIWVLSNISGDGPECRDLLNGLNIIDHIMPLLEVKGPVTYNRNLTWMISILCRSEMDSTSFAQICRFLPHLIGQLCNPLEVDILSNTIWAFTYLTDCSYHQTQVVLQTGALPWIVARLSIETHISILLPTLRCVGNVIAKSEEFANYAISVGCLPNLRKMLKHQKLMVIKRTACIFTQLSYKQNHIQAMLDAKIYTQLEKILSQGDFRIQREVALCICNTLTFGTPHQIIATVDGNGIFLPLIKQLDTHDTKTLIYVLTAIDKMFILADNLKETSSFSYKFEELGGLDKLERLQKHYNESIYEISLRLIVTYYTDDDTLEGPHSITQQGDDEDGISQKQLNI